MCSIGLILGVAHGMRREEMSSGGVTVSDMRFAHTEGICNLIHSRDGDKVYTCGADGEVNDANNGYFFFFILMLSFYSRSVFTRV